MQPTVGGGSGDEIAEQTPSELECCQPQIPILAELLCSEPGVDELLKSIEEEEDISSTSHYSQNAGGRNNNSNNNESHNKENNNVAVEPFVQSHFDPVILHHPQVMNRLKTLESRMEKPRDYLRSTGKDEILPYMRKIVASWMLEVCEEQRCGEIVFPLAVALLDKFLGTCTIKKEQLQLVACVCLLLSSKSRQCNYFSLELLSWYTDNSVSPESLRSWELMILSELQWDINVLTPTDFVDFLLVRCPGLKTQTPESQLVRRHAITFIALCSTEPRFVGLKPSLVAASAIYTASKGIRMNTKEMGGSLAQMAEVSKEQLISISTSIEHVISTEMSVIEQQSADLPMIKNMPVSTAPTPSTSSSANKLSCGQAAYGQNTPTDVQDIIV